jgi:hypothetical protein
MNISPSEFLDVSSPEYLEIEVQSRSYLGKNSQVLYVHVNGRTVLRVCQIPNSTDIHIKNREQKPLLVKFWHGTPPERSQFYKKVERLVRKSEPDTSLFFDGDIHEWMVIFGSHFLYYPPAEHEKGYIDGIIYVTQHSNFGTRG